MEQVRPDGPHEEHDDSGPEPDPNAPDPADVDTGDGNDRGHDDESDERLRRNDDEAQ